MVELEEGEHVEHVEPKRNFNLLHVIWIAFAALGGSVLLLFLIIAVSEVARNGTETTTATGNSPNVSEIKLYLLQQYCPYNDMDGLTEHCFKFNKETNKLPVILGVGWDATTRELKLPLLELTYDNVNTYDSYLYPDQLVIKNRRDRVSYRERLYESQNAFFKNTDNTEIDAETLSPTHFESDLNMIAVLSQYTNYFDISLSEVDIIPQVQKIIDTLPAKYDPIAYQSFLNDWGTHIIMSASVGRYEQQVILIRNCYSENNNTKVLEYAKSYITNDRTNVPPDFFNYSKSFIKELYGTTLRKPLLNKINVVPITDFINDENIRLNLQQAIDAFNKTPNFNTAKNINYISTANSNVTCSSSFELNLNSSKTIASPDPTQCAPTVCTRNTNGSLTSTLNTDAQFIFSNEETARSGCVGNHYLISYGPAAYNMWGYCCMDCVPEIKDNKFIGCDCPTF